MQRALDPEVLSKPGRRFALACDVRGEQTPLFDHYRDLIAWAEKNGWRALPAASERAVDGRYVCSGCAPMFRWLP